MGQVKPKNVLESILWALTLPLVFTVSVVLATETVEDVKESEDICVFTSELGMICRVRSVNSVSGNFGFEVHDMNTGEVIRVFEQTPAECEVFNTKEGYKFECSADE